MGSGILMTGPVAKKKVLSSELPPTFHHSIRETVFLTGEEQANCYFGRIYMLVWNMCLYEWENSGHPGVVTTGGRLEDGTKLSHCCNRLDGTKLSHCCNRLVQT